MCGRFSLIDGTQTIEHRFGGKLVRAQYETSSGAPTTPLFNAAPSMYLPIVRTSLPRGSGEKEIVYAKWGLVPVWGPQLRPQANARLDTADKKKMFSGAYFSRHCLVPMNSFFEWHREKGIKQPYRITVKDESLFAVAGIWEEPSSPDEVRPSFTLLTTEANSLMAKIHDRMPVIIARKDEDRWLKEVGQGVFSNIKMRYPADEMEMYPVTTRVNKVSYNEADAIKPISEPSLGF